MLVLALDTTTRTGSVAVADDRGTLAELAADPARSHAERLPGDVLAVLAQVGLRIPDVDLFAVAAGPGSFTGLRVGIATIQGLALVTGRRVVPVSTLDALAASQAARIPAGGVIAAWLDGQRRDVFSAVYRRGADRDPGALTALAAPEVAAPALILDRWHDARIRPALVVGDGALRYRHILEPDIEAVGAPLLAGVIAGIARARAAAGQAVGPAAVQPLYVRRPDAEIARERVTAEPVPAEPRGRP